jgi:hypothetical protein
MVLYDAYIQQRPAYVPHHGKATELTLRHRGGQMLHTAGADLLKEHANLINTPSGFCPLEGAYTHQLSACGAQRFGAPDTDRMRLRP